MPTSVRTDDSAASSLFERVLAIAAMVLVGIALVGFAVSLLQIGMAATWSWLAEGIWPYAFLLPVFALPAGFICVIVLLATSMLRKSRR